MTQWPPTSPQALAVVVGNKADLSARPLPPDEIRRACAEELSAGGVPAAYFEASAKDGVWDGCVCLCVCVECVRVFVQACTRDKSLVKSGGC